MFAFWPRHMVWNPHQRAMGFTNLEIQELYGQHNYALSFIPRGLLKPFCIWIHTIWECFYTSLAFLAKWFLRIYSTYSFAETWPPIVAPLYPRRSCFSQLWMYTNWGCWQHEFQLSWPNGYGEEFFFKNPQQLFNNS